MNGVPRFNLVGDFTGMRDAPVATSSWFESLRLFSPTSEMVGMSGGVNADSGIKEVGEEYADMLSQDRARY